MKLQMSFKQMSATPSIKAYCEEQSKKLEAYFEGKIHVSWTFRADKHEHVARLHVLGSHMDFFAESKTGDLYYSIEQALDRMERQIRKKKEIWRNRLHSERVRPFLFERMARPVGEEPAT